MTSNLPISPSQQFPVITGNLQPPVLVTGLSNDKNYTVTIIAHLLDGTTITETKSVYTHSSPPPVPPVPGISNNTGMSGTGVPGSKIRIYDENGNLRAEVTVDLTGHWNIPADMFPGGTSDGFTGSISVVDPNGNESDQSPITPIDGTAPAAPILLTNNAIGISGTAEPGSTITLRNSSGVPKATVTVDTNGNWSIPAASFPGETTSGFVGSITATDQAGNESLPLAIGPIDATPPTIPFTTSINDSGISGYAEPGATITLYNADGTVQAVITADGTGYWEFPASVFPNGTPNGFNGYITATDPSGNVSANLPLTNISTSVPNPPVITVANGIKLAGTAEPNSTIKLIDSLGNERASVFTNSSGNWEIPAALFPNQTTNGFSGTCTASNANGTSTPTIVLSIAGVAPNAPVIVTANSAGLTGTSVSGYTIKLLNSAGVEVASATVLNDGTWSISPSSSFQVNGFIGTCYAMDTIGNISPSVSIPAIDVTPPAAPIIKTANSYGISGTAEPGSRISLKDSTGAEVAYSFTDLNGNWTIPSNSFPGLATDGFSGTVTATDSAGNESIAVTVNAIDGTLPTTPSLTSYLDNVGSIASSNSIAATTDDTTPGLNIGIDLTDIPKLYIDMVLVDSIYTRNTGILTPKDALLIDGTYSFTYTLTDSAGNESLHSAALSITVDTIAPLVSLISYNDNVGDYANPSSTAITTDDTLPGLNIGRSITREHGIAEWYCFVGGTITYGISEINVSIFQKSPTGVVTAITSPTATPSRGTFTAIAGYIYYGNGPIHFTAENAQHKIAPLSMASTQFVYVANRAGNETGVVYFYAPYTNATVTMYHGGSSVSRGDGINGTAVSTITISVGQQGFFSISALNWYYFVSTTSVVATAAQVDISTQLGSDKTILSPVRLTNYQRFINYYATVAGTVPSTVGTNVIADTTYPVISQNIADGSGGDTAQGLAYEYLCDSYCWGNVLSDYVVVSPEASNTVVTSYWNGTAWVVWDTHTLTGGSMLNPITVQRNGTEGPGVTAIIINGLATNMATGAMLWKWEGVKPFYLCINDSMDDEMAMLGWTRNIVTLNDTPKLYINNSRVLAAYDPLVGTLTPDNPLSDGTYSFSYKLTDPAGNESLISPVITIIIDTVSPITPSSAPPSYNDNVGVITNTHSLALITDDTTPGINIGTGITTTVRLYVNDILTAATYDPLTGKLTPNSGLSDGLKSITYTLTDDAGNESGKSPAISITIDTALPTVSLTSYTDNVGTIKKSTSTDAVTDDTKPGLNIGTGLVDTPKLYINSILQDAVYDSIAGTLTPAVALADGTYSFIYTLTDEAGNTSLPSASLSITIDTVSPTNPITTPSSYKDDVGSITSNTSIAPTTDDTQPGINIGIGITDIVTLYVNHLMVASTYDPITGICTPTTGLKDGTYDFSYTLSDSIGNESAPSPAIVITVDTISPLTPAVGPVNYADDVLEITNSMSYAPVTNDNKPGINIGFGILFTPNLYVDGTKVASSYDSVAGTLTPVSAISDGLKTITYSLTDPAGNESGQSPSLTFTIDTVAPTTVAPTTYQDNFGIIQSDTNNSVDTDDTTPGINIGPGIVDGIKLYVDGVFTHSTYDPVTGSLTTNDIILDGTRNFSYTLTDAAGNESSLSPALQIIIDTVALPAPSIAPSSYVDDVGYIQSTTNTATTTNDTTPGINIPTGLYGARLYVDSVLVASTYDSVNGRLTPTIALTEGIKSITYTVLDHAANESGQSPALSITIDTTAPATPAIAPYSYVDQNGAFSTASVANYVSGLKVNNYSGITWYRVYASATGQTETAFTTTRTVDPNDSSKVILTFASPSSTYGILADATWTFKYTLLDDAGNESEKSPGITTRLDTTADVLTVTHSWGAVANAVTFVSGGTMTATTNSVENGNTVSFSLGYKPVDSNYWSSGGTAIATATVSSGSATATITGAELLALNLNSYGYYRVVAQVQDNFGNSGYNYSNSPFYVNLYPVVSSVTMSWGDTLLKAEKTSNGTVSVVTTNVIEGKTLSVTINGVTYTTTVTSNAASVTIPKEDLALIGPGSYNCVPIVENAPGYSSGIYAVPFTVPRFETLGDGDSSHGYWIAGSGAAKIIVAPKSYESNVDWGEVGVITGATTADGKNNTVFLYNTFISAHAASYAATIPLDPQISGNLITDFTWFLPSSSQLKTCMDAENNLPAGEKYTTWNSYTEVYWSSTEKDANSAFGVFKWDVSGTIVMSSVSRLKDQNLIVRPIRIAGATE